MSLFPLALTFNGSHFSVLGKSYLRARRPWSKRSRNTSCQEVPLCHPWRTTLEGTWDESYCKSSWTSNRKIINPYRKQMGFSDSQSEANYIFLTTINKKDTSTQTPSGLTTKIMSLLSWKVELVCKETVVPCRWGKEKTKKVDIKQVDEGYVTVLKGLPEIIPLH